MSEKQKTVRAWLGTGSIDMFGRPFSGKDTQAKILAELFGGVTVGGGDILRSHHEPERIKKILAEGGIVPHDFYLKLIVPYLSKKEYAGKPIIMSAVGRAHGEEATITKAAAESGHPLKAVILLDISEAEVWRRFEAAEGLGDRGRRTDDSKEVLKNRLDNFKLKTVPVFSYHQDKGWLVKVDGSLNRDQVTAEIINGLYKLAQS